MRINKVDAQLIRHREAAIPLSLMGTESTLALFSRDI